MVRGWRASLCGTAAGGDSQGATVTLSECWSLACPYDDVIHRDMLHDMATKQLRSFRFEPGTLARLDQRASDLDSTASALAERYVEDGLRHDDHPGVVSIDGPAGRRPRVAGTGLDVWEVVETVQHNGGSASEAATYLHLPEDMILVALRYYADFPREIDAWIESNAKLFEQEEQRMRRVAEALE
jgi:uncharacterized protein (DUF433 family)